MTKFVACGIVLLALLALGHGSTFFIPAEVVTDISQHGRSTNVCTYKGTRYMTGTSLRDFDSCVNCHCTETGMGCSSISMYVTNLPEDSECMTITVACELLWVLRTDETTDCPPDKMPRHISAVGK